ncbi:MAG TPA: acylphosphatase [Pedococcus sp.]|jgi:acylphosphatase|uniref:acylphosphatase n=1 Tax=Pedococcus sp. TaxID=2860345 RepID=UPI002F94DD7A
MDNNEPARAVIWVHGRVHGVGFRWWTRARALELGLVGHARNAPDGRVEVFAQGPREQVEELISLLEEKPSSKLRPGEVTTCVATWGPPRDGLVGFVEK